MKNTFLAKIGKFTVALAVATGASSVIAANDDAPATLADVEVMAKDPSKLMLAQIHAAMWARRHPGDPEQVARGNALAVRLYLKGDRPGTAAAPMVALRLSDPQGKYVSKQEQDALEAAVRAAKAKAGN